MNYDKPVPVVEKSTRPKWMPNDMYKLNPTKEDFNNYHKNKYRQTLLNIKKNGGLHEGNFWKVLKRIKKRGLKQEERVEIALQVMNS